MDKQDIFTQSADNRAHDGLSMGVHFVFFDETGALEGEFVEALTDFVPGDMPVPLPDDFIGPPPRPADYPASVAAE